jgi:hypothetical protein
MRDQRRNELDGDDGVAELRCRGRSLFAPRPELQNTLAPRPSQSLDCRPTYSALVAHIAGIDA